MAQWNDTVSADEAVIKKNNFGWKTQYRGERMLVLIEHILALVQQLKKSTYLPTYLLTYLFTPYSRILFQKLTGSQPIKRFPKFYGRRRFITAITSARHLSLPSARSSQSIPSHPISWRSILILSSNLRLGLPSGNKSKTNLMLVSESVWKQSSSRLGHHLDSLYWPAEWPLSFESTSDVEQSMVVTLTIYWQMRNTNVNPSQCSRIGLETDLVDLR